MAIFFLQIIGFACVTGALLSELSQLVQLKLALKGISACK